MVDGVFFGYARPKSITIMIVLTKEYGMYR
jgi:hypothetical protein